MQNYSWIFEDTRRIQDLVWFADEEQNFKMMTGLESDIHKLVLEFSTETRYFLLQSPSFLSKVIID